MRIWQTEHAFDHNWETVVHAAVRKYPNPQNASIVSQDVVSRRVTPNGQLHSHRLFGTNFSGLVQKLNSAGFGRLVRMFADEDAEVWYGSEHTTIDPAARHYELRARNLTLSSNFTMDECLVYRPHPEDPEGRTLLTQSVTIRCPWWPIGGWVESLLEDLVYSKMATKGPQAIEWVIANCGVLVTPPPPPAQLPPPPVQLPHHRPAGQGSRHPPPQSDFSRLCQAVEAGMQQVGAEVKHLTRLVIDEHFLIM